LAAAFCLAAAIGDGAATGQTVLSDYESSAKAAQVREAAVWRLAFRPSLQVLEQTVMSLRNGTGTSQDARAAADALLGSARGQPEPEARLRLWHAASLLLGRPWNAAEAAVGGLVLKPEHPIVTGERTRLAIAALYPADAAAGASYTLDLVHAEPTSSATPRRGAVIKRLAIGTLEKQLPLPIYLDFRDVPDGFYLLIARVASSSASATEIAAPLYVVHGLAERHRALSRRLAAIRGHDEAKQTAEYPFALAEAINAGTREVISYDFKAAMRRSDEIAAALAAGRDPVRQAKGLQNRAYRFPETGELIPYQLYVPTSWTPGRRLPLVVALHGANLDETNMLGRANGRMQQLAEQHGFVVVAPLGYRINSAYGSEHMGALGIDVVRRRRSERDVLAVADFVRAEYRTDPARQYLTGNSMGGGGTWWIGGHTPERWAAIAPAASGGVLPGDVPGLARVPILAVVGDKDELGMLDRVRSAVTVLEQGGVKPEFIVVPGGTHASAFDTAMPRIFDFFAAHRR
jgi:poly(3-hydroxybutyrate) depolymerase